MTGFDLFPILAVEYCHPEKEVKVTSVSVQAATSALESGASVLAITSFDEKEEK